MQPHVVYTQDADTQGVQTSDWVMCDSWCPGPVSIQVNVYGVATYTVESTLDYPDDPASPVPVAYCNWFPCGDVNLVNSSASAQTYYTAAPRYIRLVQTAGTGIAQMTVSQNGTVAY